MVILIISNLACSRTVISFEWILKHKIIFKYYQNLKERAWRDFNKLGLLFSMTFFSPKLTDRNLWRSLYFDWCL